MAGSGGPAGRRPAPPWALVVAAAVAAAAGVVAVATGEGVPAVVAGAASALTAVLALAGGRPVPPLPAHPPAEAVVPALRTPLPARADAAPADEPEVDPMRSLFESGPPAGSTSLLHAEFLATTLRGRVAVARRALRPLSVVCFECFETRDGQPTVSIPHDLVGAFLKRTLREADVSGRSHGDAFVCILEDTGEDGAVWTAERVRRTLLEEGPNRRFRAGIASYPTHGLDAEELLDKAHAALDAARDWGSDRIEVATPT